MGNIYIKLKQYDQALENYEKALAIRKKNFDPDHPFIARLYNDIGILYQEKQEPNLAMDYFRKSLTLKLKKHAADNPNLVKNYINIGRIHREKDATDSAYVYFHKALAITRKSFGEKHPDMGEVCSDIAATFSKQEDYEKALAYLQKSIISIVHDFNDSNYYAQPVLANIYNESHLLYYLQQKALTLQKLYSLKSYELRDLETSFSTFRLAIELIEEIRGHYQTEESRLILTEKAAGVVEQAIEIALRLFEITADTKYQNLAFSLAEKGKASVLMAALQDLEAKKFARIPDSLLEIEKDLRIDLAFYDTQIQKEQQKSQSVETETLSALKEKHFNLNQRYQQIIQRFEQDYPEYFDLKYKTQTAEVAQIQSLLDAQTSLLEYYLGDSLLTIFYISKDNYKIKSMKTKAQAEVLAESLNKAIKKLDIPTYFKSSAGLYAMLIQPFETELAAKQKLIIIPHGFLYKIPYEALIRQAPEATEDIRFNQQDYLITCFQITYHNSATLYQKNLSEEKQFALAEVRKENAFVGFAPVFDEATKNGYILAGNVPSIDLTLDDPDVRAVTLEGQRFKTLDYSEKEVQTIIRLYQKINKTQSAFSTKMPPKKILSIRYKIINVCAHCQSRDYQ